VIRFELGFNKFHSDVDRIYRMVRVSGDDMSEFRTGISYPVPRAVKAEVAGLENITSMEYFGGAYVDVLDPSGKSVAMFKEDFGCVMA
jgi:putative ABC transport system permease protein